MGTVHQLEAAQSLGIMVPYVLELEQQVLGAVLISARELDRCIEVVRPEHFGHDLHGLIWRTYVTLHGQGRAVTLPAVLSVLKDDHALVAAGGVGYLARLVEDVVMTASARDYARAIVDCAERRWAIEVLVDGIRAASQLSDLTASAGSVIEAVEAQLFEIAEQRPGETRGFIGFADSLDAALQQAEAARHACAEGRVIGVPTRLRRLDKMLSGLVRQDLSILGGRPAMGKTALCTAIAVGAARSGCKVGFFSLEMSDGQLASRVLAAHAGVPSEALRSGRLNEHDMRALIEARQDLAGLPIHIDPSAGLTLGQMRARARRLKRRAGLDLIIVDYLGLVATEGLGENRTLQLGAVSRALKGLAKELDVHVLALSQLSRKCEEREDRRPLLSDLRESGNIEQDADTVMFVYRHEYYLGRQEPQTKSGEDLGRYQDRMARWNQQMDDCANTAEVIVAKNRHGPIGMVPLHFDKRMVHFSDLADDDYSNGEG